MIKAHLKDKFLLEDELNLYEGDAWKVARIVKPNLKKKLEDSMGDSDLDNRLTDHYEDR